MYVTYTELYMHIWLHVYRYIQFLYLLRSFCSRMSPIYWIVQSVLQKWFHCFAHFSMKLKLTQFMITQSVFLFCWNVLLFFEFVPRPWQGSMADGSITWPKMKTTLLSVFSSSGAKSIDSFQQEMGSCMSCQMLMLINQQPVSSHSFLSSAISSSFWLLAPLLSLPCFVEIVYQKIAAQLLSSDCPFLFFISSAPSPYLSFISSQLLVFFLSFASGPLFAARKSVPF